MRTPPRPWFASTSSRSPGALTTTFSSTSSTRYTRGHVKTLPGVSRFYEFGCPLQTVFSHTPFISLVLTVFCIVMFSFSSGSLVPKRRDRGQLMFTVADIYILWYYLYCINSWILLLVSKVRVSHIYHIFLIPVCKNHWFTRGSELT